MNKRTRLFVLGASAILMVGIGTAGVASYVGLERIGLVDNSSGDLAFIPGTTRLVAYADVRHLMDSDLRHKLQPNLGSQQGPDGLFSETGINIETDVDSVTVAWLESASEEELPLLLVRGIFDAQRIETTVLNHGGVASQHQGIKIVTAEEKFGVAFIDSGRLALGSPASLRVALDTKAAASGNVTENAELMRLVRQVDDGNAWTVARFDALQGRAPFPTEVLKQLPSISWFAAGGKVDSSFSAVLHAETRDEQAAQDLREVIRGFVALIRIQAGQQPEFAEVLNSVQLSGEGKTVSLGFSVPAATIDRLGALTAQRPRAPAAGQLPLRPAPSQPPSSGVPAI
jgi:hypothetical protein